MHYRILYEKDNIDFIVCCLDLAMVTNSYSKDPDVIHVYENTDEDDETNNLDQDDEMHDNENTEIDLAFNPSGRMVNPVDLGLSVMWTDCNCVFGLLLPKDAVCDIDYAGYFKYL